MVNSCSLTSYYCVTHKVINIACIKNTLGYAPANVLILGILPPYPYFHTIKSPLAVRIIMYVQYCMVHTNQLGNHAHVYADATIPSMTTLNAARKHLKDAMTNASRPMEIRFGDLGRAVDDLITHVERIERARPATPKRTKKVRHIVTQRF
jgi:hypothetical protein